MAIPAPFKSSLMRVEDQWIDYNGHFNMAYYNVLFDRAGDEALASLGLGPDYVRTTNCSFFTLEAHITYLRELHAGDQVMVSTQFLAHDHKRVHYVQEMFHAAGGYVACVAENMIMHIDMTARKSSNFPQDMLDTFAAVQRAHDALPVPKQVGHRITIPAKKP